MANMSNRKGIEENISELGAKTFKEREEKTLKSIDVCNKEGWISLIAWILKLSVKTVKTDSENGSK